MPDGKKEIQLEIAHVLFMDIVGYSKLSINEQRAVVDELTKVVRSSDQCQKAEAAGRLIKIPTGDGMALVFYTSPEAPAQCAVEISGALTKHPRLQLRMGVHSGPVSGVIDVNGHPNLAGAGLNMAQRVMDCGDAGHILLSQRVAEDLGEYEQWRPLLHDLGACEVKHGARVSIVNLHADQVGNPDLPKKFQVLKKRSARLRWATMAAALLALVAIVAGIAMFPRSRVGSTMTAPEKSIAVLPFENLSEDKSNAYFADGVQDEILTRLSKIADLKVISRTSTVRYKSSPNDLPQIAKQLGVAHILEGSVQKSADEVRVNVQLIKAATDAHLWAETFDRKLTDIFSVESEVAKAIADQLRAKLSGSEEHAISSKPTADPAAHELYLKGRFFWNKRTADDLKKGIEYFQQAIERDPNYAPAYAGLADCESLLPFYTDMPPRETFPRAKADAHSSLAYLKAYYDWDWSEAEKEFKRSLELNPNYATAHHVYSRVLASLGRLDEARAEIKRAHELDPLSLGIQANVGMISYFGRQYDQAIKQLQETLELDQKLFVPHWGLGMAYEQKGMYEDAVAHFQQAVSLSGGSTNVIASLGHAYAAGGHEREAQKIIEELKGRAKKGYVSSYQIALVYIGLGHKDQAMEWLEKACEERSTLLGYLKMDPRFDSLRSDPRFEKLASLIFPPPTSNTETPIQKQ